MRDAFAQELLALARSDDRVVFVTGDLGFGVFEEYRAAVPDQYLNVGVAEQNMVAVGTGLALEGHRVFVYSIGNFPVLRCLEQIRNDAAYHGANLTVVSIGGGFSYGPLGMSHHATEDIAVMRALPDVATVVPGTLHEVRESMRALADRPGTSYLRLDKSAGSEPVAAVAFDFGTWRVLTPGSDVTFIATGGILCEAQSAAAELAASGISARVVSAHLLSPLESAQVLDAIGPAKHVITLEEHVVRGGLGSAVAEIMVENPTGARLTRMGLTGSYVSTVGSQVYLRGQAGINAHSLVGRTRELLAQEKALELR